MESIKRRDFFGLSLAPILGMNGALVSTPNKNPVSLKFTCRSTKDFDFHFNNPTEFWNQHLDPVADLLNGVFLKKGWLQSLKSEVAVGEPAVLCEKVYRNKYYFDLYQRMWSFLSSQQLYEESVLEYSNVKVNNQVVLDFDQVFHLLA